MNTSTLSNKDREALLRLVRGRKKLARTMVTERSAKLKADFEQQIAAIYKPHDRETWDKANQMAQAAVAEANRQVAAECAKLGILSRFAPHIQVGWSPRGENAVAERRAELRKVADSMIGREEKTAITAIERTALETETEILAGALSEAGQKFLEQMPAVEGLMPPLELSQMEALLPRGRYDEY